MFLNCFGVTIHFLIFCFISKFYCLLKISARQLQDPAHENALQLMFPSLKKILPELLVMDKKLYRYRPPPLDFRILHTSQMIKSAIRIIRYWIYMTITSCSITHLEVLRHRERFYRTFVVRMGSWNRPHHPKMGESKGMLFSGCRKSSK